MEEREERAKGAAEQDDVVLAVDRNGEGGFVGVQVVEDTIQQRGWAVIQGAVEGEEGGEEGEDKGKRDLVSC